MASLLNLPPELLQYVVSLADPASHLDFALANRYIFACLKSTIEYHRACQSRFRVITDISPSTIPELLRDPIASWHVRNIEIWSSRHSWGDWKKHELNHPNEVSASSHAEHVIKPISPDQLFTSTYFTQDDLDHLMMIMEKDLYFDHSTAWRWRGFVEDGCDLALKGILIALCPRLQSLRLIYEPTEKSYLHREEGDAIDEAWFHGLFDESEEPTDTTIEPRPHELLLRFMAKSIRAVIGRSNEAHPWPVGLASLREVSVGIRSEAQPPSTPYPYWLNPSAVASLFRLPRVESLYIAGLGAAAEWADSPDQYYGTGSAKDPLLCPGTSTVQKIFFEHSGQSLDTLLRFLRAPCALTSLAFQHCDMSDFDLDLLSVPTNAQQSLECFSIFGCQTLGYRSIYSWENNIDKLTMMSWTDLCSNSSRDRRPDAAALANFRENIGYGIQDHQHFVVIVDGDMWNPMEGVDMMDQFDDALTEMLWRDDARMDVIFLANMDHGHTEKFQFRKAIMAGRKRGIEVVTAANPMSEAAQALLPRGKSDADIMSSPWRDHPRVRNLVVDPIGGLGPAGCNSCGKCEGCLAKYPKELWDARDAGEYFTVENFKKWRHEDKARQIADGTRLVSEDEDDGGVSKDSDWDSWEEEEDEEDEDDDSEEIKDSKEDKDSEVVGAWWDRWQIANETD